MKKLSFTLLPLLTLFGCQTMNMHDKHLISVTKTLGTTQCSEHDSALELKKLKTTLEGSHIQIYEAKIGNDGMSHIAMCGAADGKMAIFKIDQKSLPKAEKLGYTQTGDH